MSPDHGKAINAHLGPGTKTIPLEVQDAITALRNARTDEYGNVDPVLAPQEAIVVKFRLRTLEQIGKKRKRREKRVPK